jgi:hypothetical protein
MIKRPFRTRQNSEKNYILKREITDWMVYNNDKKVSWIGRKEEENTRKVFLNLLPPIPPLF